MVKPMTPTERAEEILDDHWGICEGRDILEKTIAAALTAARAEGWAEAIKRLDGIQKEAHWLGFRECQAKAAELTVDHNGCVNDECFKRNCATVLFDQIKALAPEEK